MTEAETTSDCHVYKIHSEFCGTEIIVSFLH